MTYTPPAPWLSPDELIAGKHRVDMQILKQLKDVPTTDDLQRCLSCGYDGAMPIKRSERPWWGSLWVLILVCMTGVGLFFAVVLQLATNGRTKHFAKCPNCSEEHVATGDFRPFWMKQ